MPISEIIVLMAKAKKRKPARASSHHHTTEHHHFLLIVGGGFLLMLLILLMYNNLPFINSYQKQAAVTAEDSMEQEEVQQVVMKDYAFSPSSITVKAGTIVTFVNQDPVAHSVVADDGTFSTQLLEQDAEEQVTFDTPGTYTYHCEPHPNMTGTVVVEE